MITYTRLQELEDFKTKLSRLDDFLNRVGPREPIQIIDPDQNLYEFGRQVGNALCWARAEIGRELERENDLLPDEGRDRMWRVGQ